MGVSYERIARDVAFTLSVKSPKVFENIFLNNGVLVLMGLKGRVRIVAGGNRFDERTRLGQNSNVDHRDKFAAISTNMQNNVVTAYYGQAVCDGAAMVNLVEEDQNAGPQRIEALAEDAIEECMNTFPNKIADALMKSTSTSVDPTSIVEELPATAFGSQTQTTGGIVRSDYPGTSDPTKAWQTQYSNDSADLSSEAGIATVSKFIWACSPGGSALSERPDICLTTTGVIAKASAKGDVLRRFDTNDKLAKFGFDNFSLLNCAFIADRNVGSKKGYFLNVNYMRIQVLGGARTRRTRSIKVIGDGATAVPLQVRPPIESYNELNYAIKMYIVYNLTFGGLRQHGLMDNLTEA